MLDPATRKELVALVYERVEGATGTESELYLLADDGDEHFGTVRRWYEALLLCAGSSYSRMGIELARRY
jgi:hypothetical protein